MPLRIFGPVIKAAIWLIAWTFPTEERKSIHEKRGKE